MKKALVLAGGGAVGAFSSGVISYLVKEENKSWDYVIGTSTGSLLAPLSAIGKVDKLKEAYTSVNNDSIFDIKPFNEKGKLRLFNAIWRLICGKTSLGRANNLKKKIKEIITKEEYDQILSENKEVIAVVSNMTKFQVEYKSSNDYSYEEFCEWMLCSASFPILFDVQTIDDNQYLDGGILEPIPLQKAVNQGATEIDVIILNALEHEKEYGRMENMIDVAARTVGFMNKEITKDDLVIGKLEGEAKEVKINIYRIPYSLTNNSIVFNKEKMSEWWQLGYEYAKEKNQTQITLNRTKSDKVYKVSKRK